MVYKDKNKRREYYQKNKERLNQQRREYNKKPEVKKKAREYDQRYWEKNKDKLKEKSKKYYQKNKDKIKENARKYRQRPEVKIKMKKYIRDYYQKNKEKIEKQIVTYRKKNVNKIKERAKKYYQNNMENKKEYGKQNYEENKDKKIAYSKKYYEENQDKVKDYLERNKERIKKRVKGYGTNRRKTDMDFKLKTTLRISLWKALKSYSKTGKIMSSKKYGVDYKKIIEHLKPFPKDIENYEVDHIIPLSKFDFNNVKHIKIAFAPENHQWLPKEINRWKHNRLIIPMTKEQQDKLLKRLKMTKEYYCSKHGNDGNPNCKECIDNLKRLAEDNNAIIIGDLK